MWEKMDSWLIMPLKTLLRYCVDSCYGRKKSSVTKTDDVVYVPNSIGTSTKNIIKLLAFTQSTAMVSAIQLPQLFFKDSLNQTYSFAFDPSASRGSFDFNVLNQTIKIINNEILSQCNVEATTLFKYTPEIVKVLSCSTHSEFSVHSVVFNLISDKNIIPILVDCVNQQFLNNFNFCTEDSRTISRGLGIAFGVVGAFLMTLLCVILYLNRITIKAKIKECCRPKETTVRIALEDNSISNDADETTALVPSL